MKRNIESEFSKEPKDYPVNPEDVVEQLRKAKNILGWLGCKNLTNIELFNLKKDIESALKNRSYLEAKYSDFNLKNLNTRRLNKVFPFEEAVARFLSHYGIDMSQVNFKASKKLVLSDQIIRDIEGTEYIRRKLETARQEAHKPYLD